MPELPDIEAYLAALGARILNQELSGVRLGHPFLLRTVEPPLEAVVGRRVVGLERVGKRIVLELGPADVGDVPVEGQPLFLVLHLMIAGRLHWRPAGARLSRSRDLAAFDFAGGSLVVSEAGKKRRASLHILAGREALQGVDRGGLNVLEATLEQFAEVLKKENHTLKRALTDPRLLSGIGNAYSDEILHCARLSPFRQTGSLSAAEVEALYAACREVLEEWTDRLITEAKEGFPEHVTAFRPGMRVHGRYRQPCPVCGTAIQRIVYAENEANYCPRCQTEGRLLADRALSRLLRSDWPRTIDELENRSNDEASRRKGRGGDG